MRTIVSLVCLAVLGVLAAVTMPVPWFTHVFLGAVGVTLVLAVGASVMANESTPVGPATKVVSFIFLGTSRPIAVIPPSAVLRWFGLATAFTLGLAMGVLWLAG